MSRGDSANSIHLRFGEIILSYCVKSDDVDDDYIKSVVNYLLNRIEDGFTGDAIVLAYFSRIHWKMVIEFIAILAKYVKIAIELNY